MALAGTAKLHAMVPAGQVVLEKTPLGAQLVGFKSSMGLGEGEGLLMGPGV